MKKRPSDPTKIIDEIQVSLSETNTELRAYMTLFQALGPDSLKGEELKGFSVVLNRLIRNLDETNNKLSEIYGSLLYHEQ